MSANSAIEWTDATWNPVTGCTKIGPGCDNCYAERFAERWRGIEGHPYEQGFDLRLWPSRLRQPSQWKKPRMIFVNSMSDLFHKHVDRQFIDNVFDAMETTDRHVYQVLTKRSSLMRRYVRDRYREGKVPKHIWLGVSCSDQLTADANIPHLLETPAAVRFVSLEPLLDAVKFLRLYGPGRSWDWLTGEREDMFGKNVTPRIAWVIAGGESGPGARPMNPDWARSLRDQCVAAGVPFFFKQWGEWGPHPADITIRGRIRLDDGQYVRRVGKKRAGRLLDGREWNEMPIQDYHKE